MMGKSLGYAKHYGAFLQFSDGMVLVKQGMALIQEGDRN